MLLCYGAEHTGQTDRAGVTNEVTLSLSLLSPGQLERERDSPHPALLDRAGC